MGWRVIFERRLWAFFIPPLVLVSGAFGLPLTEDALNAVLDNAVATITVAAPSVLAIWSWLKPKPPASGVS
jgi:hypothetical protein